MRPDSFRFGRSALHGFTLVEIMIVVVIIGLLAALAIPSIQRVQRASQNSRLANDFRVFAQAFEIYNSMNSTWPDEANAGEVPTLPVTMTDDFKVSAWQSPTVIGGSWDWDRAISGYTAGVSISNFTCTQAQLVELDIKMDDGDLTTGRFQLIQPARVMLILER